MSYELTLHIHENSPQEHNIESLAVAERISREEAALRLLGTSHLIASTPSHTAIDRRAAVKAVTGSLKGCDWILHDFNDEKRAEIESENERDFI